ncbi:hypothetical protein M3Y94_00701300 [Aphelenchoides besseyi]|nr:hypothetical protein M3Y94_00701300 [Aphelenchoides besseyi]
MFSTDYYSLLINDLFFSKSQQIDFDFSFMAIQSSTATSNNSFRVFIILPINLNTLIVDFGKYDQSYHKERYLGIGRIDFVHSIITIGNVKQMDVINRSYDIVGRSYSSNKSIVLLELSSNHLNDTSYQKITIEKSGDFELSTPIYLSNDFVDVFLYGDYICSFNALRSHPYNFQTLYRYSIAGETTKMTTTNSEITHQDGFLTPGHHLVCVGSTLFTVGSLIDQNQKRIFSFDLEILEWRRANLEFNCEDLDLHSDGMNTLIVTAKYKAEEYTVYRYKINQPDSLLDCAWIAIKRRSEFDRQVLDYAESKLPKNSRQRCLIRQ